MDVLLERATAELEKDEIDVSMTIDPMNQALADIDSALRQGQMAKALELVRDGLEIFPDNTELMIRLEQLEARESSLPAGPRVPELPSGIPSHYVAIRTLINTGETQEAIDALRAWVEKAVPGQATAHYLTGIALQDLNKIPRGISFLKRSLHGEDLPENLRIFVHYELACAYQSMEDMDEATYYLKRVIRSRPEFLDAKERLDRISSVPTPA